MKAKIKVTFDMVFDEMGECKTQVRFALPGYPKATIPETAKKLVIEQIKMLCVAMGAASEFMFSDTALVSRTQITEDAE